MKRVEAACGSLQQKLAAGRKLIHGSTTDVNSFFTALAGSESLGALNSSVRLLLDCKAR